MPRYALVMLALLHVAVLPAGAAEFIPGWDVDGVWSSNVLPERRGRRERLLGAHRARPCGCAKRRAISPTT